MTSPRLADQARGALARAALIAEREFAAYVATASFWIALAIGPVAMAAVLFLNGLNSAPATADRIGLRADEPWMSAAAVAAIDRAYALESRSPPVLSNGPGAIAVAVSRSSDGGISTRISGPIGLSASGEALVATSLERDAALHALGKSARAERPAAQTAPVAPSPENAAAYAHFALVMVLWLTLTGSLGMLLQAVVRERANRALETLLAAARPAEIVFGKLAGVGAVSLLVLGAWLLSCAGLGALAPSSAGIGMVVHALANPGLLAGAIVVYLLAYLLFGLVTVAIGAAAGDSAAAQNLSRPMFAVLLAVFFAALAATGNGGEHLAWLVYAPPFTPFMLLLKPPAIAGLAVAISLMIAAITASAWFAVRGVSLKSAKPGRRGVAKGQPGVDSAVSI